MKKVIKSIFIKKNTLSEKENNQILEDIITFNKIKHTAFSWNNRNHFNDDKSIYCHLKDRFHFESYFINNANREALSSIKSQNALKTFYIDNMKEDIKGINKAITKKRKYLSSLQEVQKSLIKYTKLKSKNPDKIVFCNNIKANKDSSVTIKYYRKETRFENVYLFEIKWLKPQIRRLKQNIAAMSHKKEVLKSRIKAMKNDKKAHICYGSGKLFHDTRLHGDTRKRTLFKSRNKRMMISGRSDSFNGNYVFSYDTNTHTLYYKSMTDWKGRPIAFKNVLFPYKQKELDDFVDEKKLLGKSKPGCLAWEIADFGNAWQISCVLDWECENHINNSFVDGCVSYDINYDNFAVTELDSKGNLLHHFVIRFSPEKCTKGQLEQILSHSLEKIYKYALKVHKPVVCESIHSVQRKRIYDKNKKRTRRISMFASTKIQSLSEGKSCKYKTLLLSVNPAYTSKTGLLKYKKRYGLSTHEAASFVIGRRGLGFMDKVPEFWKDRLKECQRYYPRKKQWSYVNKMLQKLNYKELNETIYRFV